MGWFWMANSFSTWNPALVNWYTGPGWIGWTPVGPAGLGGAAPCTLAAAGCVTAVNPGVLRNAQPIVAGSGPYAPLPIAAGTITPVARPDIAPASSALSGQPIAGGVAALSAASPTAAFTRGVSAAPSSVMMGQQVSTDAFLSHRGVFSGPFGYANEPIHVRLGAAMGGQPPTAVTASGAAPAVAAAGSRVSRGVAKGPVVAAAPHAQVLSHASFADSGAGGFGPRTGGGAPAGISRGGGSAGAAHAGGGVVGGAPSTGSTGSVAAHH